MKQIYYRDLRHGHCNADKRQVLSGVIVRVCMCVRAWHCNCRVCDTTTHTTRQADLRRRDCDAGKSSCCSGCIAVPVTGSALARLLRQRAGVGNYAWVADVGFGNKAFRGKRNKGVIFFAPVSVRYTRQNTHNHTHTNTLLQTHSKVLRVSMLQCLCCSVFATWTSVVQTGANSGAHGLVVLAEFLKSQLSSHSLRYMR